MSDFYNDDYTDDMEQIGELELLATSPEERLEETIEWLWTLPIPDVDKMDIEAKIRMAFKHNPKMLDGTQRGTLDMEEV